MTKILLLLPGIGQQKSLPLAAAQHSIWAVHFLYDRCLSLVRIAGSRSDLFPVSIGVHQGCSLSWLLLITFMEKMFMLRRGVMRLWFGDLRIGSLHFADDVVMLASPVHNLKLSLDEFTAECKVVGKKISTSTSETMVLNFGLGRRSRLK